MTLFMLWRIRNCRRYWYIHCVSEKNVQTLKRYRSKL